MRKKVLITGGASGLGKSLSACFAKEDYDVLLTYNNSEIDALNLKKELEEKYNVLVNVFKCDLSCEDDINSLLSKIDYVDVLVNNAAVEIDKDFYQKTKSDFIYTLEVNLVAPFLISRDIGKKMISIGHGKIINIASNNAISKMDPITLEYDASKAGLINLTHNLALEFAPFVNVNAIAPGWIKTEKIKKINDELDGKFIEEESKKILLNRFSEMEDVCNLVLFLASEKANYINSEVIRIDGGSL
ncbi:MAG: SDR family oxidoreductase [Bacilli bacterium]|nr:SDR family oxidoreductase [Bacilli bacterium]